MSDGDAVFEPRCYDGPCSFVRFRNSQIHSFEPEVATELSEPHIQIVADVARRDTSDETLSPLVVFRGYLVRLLKTRQIAHTPPLFRNECNATDLAVRRFGHGGNYCVPPRECQ